MDLAGGGDTGPLAVGLTMMMPLEGCFLEELVDAPPLSVWILREKSLSMLDRQCVIPTHRVSSWRRCLYRSTHGSHFGGFANIKVSSKRGCQGLLLHRSILRPDNKSFLSKLECKGCRCTISKQVSSKDIEVGSLVFLALLVLLLFIFFVYLSFEALSLKAHVIFGCVYPRVDIEDGFLYPLSKKC
jgi:hypothetical protein